jgi:hypothetical protein
MLGLYENFPANIHRTDSFTSPLLSRKLQQRLIQVLHKVNCETFSFEEVAYPTVHECKIIFEVGLADAKSFSYIDEEETKKALTALRKATFQTIDFFCAVRYYKGAAKAPLKFDYYLMRFVFGKNCVEIQVFHERGPQYISPEDLVAFLVNEINETSARKILKRL